MGSTKENSFGTIFSIFEKRTEKCFYKKRKKNNKASEISLHGVDLRGRPPDRSSGAQEASCAQLELRVFQLVPYPPFTS
jgi:hypothetical protein